MSAIDRKPIRNKNRDRDGKGIGTDASEDAGRVPVESRLTSALVRAVRVHADRTVAARAATLATRTFIHV